MKKTDEYYQALEVCNNAKEYHNMEVMVARTYVRAYDEAINYTPCCTELKAFKNDETVALDGTLEVKIVNIESKVLVKVIEDDTLMWVKKDRLKKEYSF